MEDLLPGFRFYPTEEELVSFYLLNKLNGTKPEIDRVIPLVDIYNYNPWDLPQIGGGLGSGLPADGEQWFFFIPRQEREGRGGRPNRLTAEGYWKATGSPCDVYSSNNCIVIGRKRSMVFYAGRAPNGTKTDWKMNEYKAIDHQPASASASTSASSTGAPNPQLRDEFSLCRIYRRSRSSLWAFDRRPPMRGDQAAAQHHHHGGTTDDAAALINYDRNVMNIPDQTMRESSISHNDSIPSQPSSLEHDNVNPCWDSQQLDDWFNM